MYAFGSTARIKEGTAYENTCFATAECRYVRLLLLSHLAGRVFRGFATRRFLRYYPQAALGADKMHIAESGTLQSNSHPALGLEGFTKCPPPPAVC
jgi:hypothetical protein